MSTLHTIIFPQWHLISGKILKDVPLTYQVFGPELGSAPVVLVNHALTGNSNVAGDKGWWQQAIGEGKAVDTRYYTVMAFNIPGNGYQSDWYIEDYMDVAAEDVAAFFWEGLNALKVTSLFALIGGSLGGGIAWHMALQEPDRVQNLVPVATGWKATDWLIANVLVQDRILNNSVNPLADARIHAMLLYRTPQSLNERFERREDGQAFAVSNWLVNHGNKLEKRFALASYKLMNHLLSTISRGGQDHPAFLNQIKAVVHLVAVDTDLLFTADESKKTFSLLCEAGIEVYYYEIHSIHGHDAFLMEHEQFGVILNKIFEQKSNFRDMVSKIKQKC